VTSLWLKIFVLHPCQMAGKLFSTSVGNKKPEHEKEEEVKMQQE
jgi:hypothetical protein